MSQIRSDQAGERPVNSEVWRRGTTWWRSWPMSIAIGVLAWIVYMANGRGLAIDDTIPAMLLPHALADGDGLTLDRFAFLLRDADGRLPDYLSLRRGHLVSRYPVAPALLAAPWVWSHRWVFQHTKPGWRPRPILEYYYAYEMAKWASAMIGAVLAVALHRLLLQVSLERVALPVMAAAAFGSSLWTIGSQALWQHGPAALALVLAMLCVSVPNPGRTRHALCGVCAGVLVAFRLSDVVFALLIMGWVARNQPRMLVWWLPGFVAIVAATLAYNQCWFGTPAGGLAELESLHPRLHGVSGPWTWNLLPGLAGTLVSPSRGLFVFMPWIVLAVGLLPWSAPVIRQVPLVSWVLWGLVPYTLMLAGYSVWWGGFCFGPRYWTDVVPPFAILLGFSMDWARMCRPRLLPIFGLVIAWSIAIQTLGAFCYPSSWSLNPNNIDTHHERLWDWRDSELTRCLSEKVFQPARR